MYKKSLFILRLLFLFNEQVYKIPDNHVSLEKKYTELIGFPTAGLIKFSTKLNVRTKSIRGVGS